ncbi:hypothetical protein A6V39_03625 [Candidatus Mycoplasma haematobovis]|uniref:Uncharacterized protein n=1 Tax=Candidatus Mycoplasma haematobovis TaxID=432608 RepID=A0A1A9QDE0_9MOLU|nr:hypothetical protein [Candidatus Mycoplasma haematobovis]OAL09976.1 hypothetical protein A6V39_03625 [Candidatus Mycoplasma haematobovis]
MNSLALKGSAVLLGGSGLVVGGYYGLKALDYQGPISRTVDNIRKILEDQKYTLLTSGNREIQTIIQKYQESIRTNNNLKLGDFTGNKVGEKTSENILLEQCGLILKNDYTDSNNLEKAKRWCVVPTTASALLTARQITVLSTDDGGTNKKEWTQKISEYNRDKGKPRISGLNLENPSPNTEDQKIKEIKTKCKEIGGKYNHEDKFEENLNLLKLWCTNN